MAGEKNNPFQNLPFPSPGDRIQADDFKRLSLSLRIVSDFAKLSGSLFGRNFRDGKLALIAQQYTIEQVMSVFGTEIDNSDDETLDDRKIIQVLPVELGTQRVKVVLTEAVETRRFAPDLIGLTYRDGSAKLKSILGDITFPSTSINASELVGLSLAEAKQNLSK